MGCARRSKLWDPRESNLLSSLNSQGKVASALVAAAGPLGLLRAAAALSWSHLELMKVSSQQWSRGCLGGFFSIHCSHRPVVVLGRAARLVRSKRKRPLYVGLGAAKNCPRGCLGPGEEEEPDRLERGGGGDERETWIVAFHFCDLEHS